MNNPARHIFDNEKKCSIFSKSLLNFNPKEPVTIPLHIASREHEQLLF